MTISHHKIRILLLLIFLFLIGGIKAQSNLDKVYFKPISMRSGLSSPQIHCIFQDSRGFIWVGTEDGLNRFDGYSFKAYRTNEGDSTSLQATRVRAINEDQNGNLWIGSAEGLHIYNRQEDRFYTSYAMFRKDLSKARIERIFKDKNKNLWILGRRIFYKLETKTQKLIQQKEWEYTYTSISEGKGSELWLGTSGKGVLVIDALTGKLIKQYLHNPLDTNNLASNDIRDIVYDQANQCVWLGTLNKGLDKLDLRRQKFQHFDLNPHNQNTIHASEVSSLLKKGNSLWIGKENGGLSIMDIKLQRFTHYLPEKDKDGSLNDISIWSLYQDQQERVWIGTFVHGLSVVDKYAQKFEKVAFPLKNQTVNAVFKDSRKRLWIGTEGGIAVMEDKKPSQIYQHTPQDIRSLGNNPTLTFYEDSKKQIWVGTWNGGLNLFDEKTKNFTRYMHQANNPKSLPDSRIIALLETKEENFLVGTFGKGIAILEDQRKGIFIPDIEIVKANDFKVVYTLFQDKKGNIWSGQNDGLYRLNLQSKNPKSKTERKFEGDVGVVYYDSKENIYLGMVNGLYKMRPNGKTKHYTTKDGLANNTIMGILEDSKGNLWISSNKGLSKFNPQTETFRNYGEEDGIQGDNFRKNACFKTQDGEFFFGGVMGLNRFYPDSLKDNPYIPPVIFTNLRIFNQSVKVGDKDLVLKKNIQETGEITFSHIQSVFTIEYVALNYTHSEKNQYAYILEGFETKWNYVGIKKEATYTNLDPGTYVFRVKASNNDGVWNEEGARLIIHILPPWWETWWFRTIAISLFLSSGIVFYFNRINAVKKQNKKLEQQVSQRTRELSEAYESLQTSEEELRQNQEEIIAQRDFIENQNKNLSHQNTQIKNSINAALTIQKAILPIDTKLKKVLQEYYLIYQPKDIVSGDFYLVEQIENKTILVAADCTGHGVPGAFMSLISSNLLGKIILAIRNSDSATILEQLHKQVRLALNQEESSNNYGLDISVAILEAAEESQQKIIFAGAKRPLYYISADNSQEVQTIGGTRKSIGGIQNENIVFENHTINLPHQSMIYLSSDGLIDQNDAKRNRLGTKRVFETLVNTFSLKPVEQKQALLDLLEKQLQDTTQRDDILWLGVRV